VIELLGQVEVREETAEQLALKAQAGCVHSFEQLVELFKNRLTGYLVQLLGNTHDAEDIAQETFVRAYRNLRRYDSQYRFSTWLYAIGKNTAITFQRRRRPTESIEGVAETLSAPSVEMGGAEEAAQIWAVARKLKPKMFEVLWLRYAEDFEIAEIARVMKTNAIYVKVLLHRARNELGKRLRRRNAAPGKDFTQ
jgi:RNA polymerase sigma-70 factor, ECF subfamily